MFKNILFLLLFFLSVTEALEPEIKPHNANTSAEARSSGFGVEINPVLLLLYEEDWLMFSGGISYFDEENAVEIAMPLYYESISDDYFYGDLGNAETLINIDLQYRKFIFGKLNGLHIGVLGRYTFLDGKLKNDDRFARVHKFGLGAEIGFRIMFRAPLYMGVSLSAGRYFGNNNDLFDFDNSDVLWKDDARTFFDLEFLKLGYRF